MEFSFEAIRDRIKDGLQNPVNRVEGGFSMDNIGAVSQELAMAIAMEVKPIPDNVMLDTAEGLLLDRKAVDFNEARNPAKSAVGEITFTGTVGTAIPKDTVALAENLAFTTMKAAAITDDGSCVVEGVCSEAGRHGNVNAGEINNLRLSLDGISSVTNAAAFTGGVDEESDSAFRARILEKIRKPITSGNKNHYVYWAKQVSGVGKAKVIACYNGAGTVKVIVLSDTYGIPDDTVIQNVTANIEANRPVGASVTVSKATPKPVSIVVTVTLAEGYSVANVKQKITAALQEYLRSIAFDETKQLSYYKVGDLVFGIDGVTDITNYTLNGGKVSLQTDFEEFFVLQEVTVNGSE